MHYSAKRGIAIAYRLSVWLFVTLMDQDHIGWKSWKLIASSKILHADSTLEKECKCQKPENNYAYTVCTRPKFFFSKFWGPYLQIGGSYPHALTAIG